MLQARANIWIVLLIPETQSPSELDLLRCFSDSGLSGIIKMGEVVFRGDTATNCGDLKISERDRNINDISVKSSLIAL
jgi:hypothetical protein